MEAIHHEVPDLPGEVYDEQPGEDPEHEFYCTVEAQHREMEVSSEEISIDEIPF